MDAVRTRRLIVLPTDTVYGVGARPDDSEATDRLFEAKARPRDLALPILVADVADAERVGVLDDRARLLATEFWPGALTIVLPRSALAADWQLGAEAGTVAVRVPAHPVAGALLSQTGPLAVTSANRSGERTPSTCEGVIEALGDAVEVVLCAGDLGEGVPSTVVDLTGDELRVLRAGAVDVGTLGN